MKFARISRADESGLELRLCGGVPAELDIVAAAAQGHGRLHGRSWFQAEADASARVPQTLVATRRGADPIIALPIAPMHHGVRMVPGCYWPQRSFPAAADATAGEMAALLRSEIARRLLGRIWRIGPVYADDPALRLLKRAAPASGWIVIERRVATSYVLDIDAARADGPWPRTSTLRKNRFHEKHLGEHGALHWRFVSGKGWNSAVFDDLAAIENRSWVGRQEGADVKFLSPEARCFWERLAHDPAAAERMWAAILYVGSKPAAFSFDVDVGETKYAIANSYDPAFAKHSPGKCLYYRNLVEAVERRGIRRIDWGAGDSGYKRTIGAVAGPEIVDCLVVRGPLLARVLAPIWGRSGK